MLTILFDGIAYGMLLFVLACGLSVTLGLMNFINLAHGSFAMAGGYCTVILVNRMGVPFAVGVLLAFLVTAALGGLLERTLYVHVYARSHLDQVLFTIGLVFMSVATTDYIMGSAQQFVEIPKVLQGKVDVFGIGMGKYRLLIIAVCGALAAEILGLDPIFPLKYMIYFLIVVTVGGTSSITGPLLASILLGIGDVAGKYYVPKLGAFVIYTIMIVVLICRPQGLFARSGQDQMEAEQTKLAPLVLKYFAKIRRHAHGLLGFFRRFGNAR